MGITSTIFHIRLILAIGVVMCAAHHVQGCRDDQFMCRTGECIGPRCSARRCIPASYKCDGDQDCRDGSDETTWECGTDCTMVKSRKGGFACSDGRQCIRFLEICDGHNDCKDGSDEFSSLCCVNARPARPNYVCSNCRDDQFRCANGECIEVFRKCNGDNNCGDGSDETTETCGANCEKMEGRFACSDGGCIPASYKCDGGSPDCRDGSDEDPSLCG